MLGGDGKIIEESLSMGILVVDVISYSLKGLVLGLLMKNYDVKNPDEIEQITNTRFIICSIIYGVLFDALNYLRCASENVCRRQFSKSTDCNVYEIGQSRFHDKLLEVEEPDEENN